jgi:hypothetical protein
VKLNGPICKELRRSAWFAANTQRREEELPKIERMGLG